MDNQDIFSYIISEESAYQTLPISITDGWEWNMYKHVRLSTLYKNGQLETKNDGMKPINNIIKPILNVAYRSEGFDVKDITPFVDDEKYYYKSFLVKKRHSKWARVNDIDTFIDQLVESYVDYGLVAVKYVNDPKPEVVHLSSLAFCDQTDFQSGVKCIKHQYTPDQMQEMKWDKDKVDTCIDAAIAAKSVGMMDSRKNATPQKYITVYEIHGMLPTRWLKKEDGDEFDVEGNDYTPQAQYVCFATDEQREKKQGIVLWKGREKKDRFKSLKRDDVYGRACGYGGIEELIEPQVWTTYSNIKIRQILDNAALVLTTTTDPAFAEKNKTTELDGDEIHVLADGKTVNMTATPTVNMTAFDNFIGQWYSAARTTGSASEAALAVKPNAGTPFALQDLNVQQALEMHQYRQGKIATFVGEIYRDWILPWIAQDLATGDKWIDELSLEEMQWIADQLAENAVTDKAIAAFRAGNAIPTMQEGEALKQIIKDEFKKSGNKKFLEIFKNEMKTLPMDVEMNIAGKQKDLAKLTSGLNNIFRQVFANPNILQNPAMAKLFNQIVEAAGLSPVDFANFTVVPTVSDSQPTDQATPTAQPATGAVA